VHFEEVEDGSGLEAVEGGGGVRDVGEGCGEGGQYLAGGRD